MYYIEDYGHKHQQPQLQQAQQIAESKNMNKKELRGLIRESIEEIHEEQEDQQKLLAMKRIQAYAHWGAKNAKKHPEELQSLFERIVKDIDDLIKSEGTEVPIKHTSQQKSPLGVTEETISKTKHLLDQMLSQRRKK
jgi:formate-dependent nitrite reductase cytochrome c552 subunit